MYQYLRKMMDLADEIGNVEKVNTMEWGADEKKLILKGKSLFGRKFELELTIEEEKNGD